MKALVLACALGAAATIADAGTLTVKWEGGEQLVHDCWSDCYYRTAPAAELSFDFSVANLSAPDFTYVGSLYDTGASIIDVRIYNSHRATLLSRPSGPHPARHWIFGSYTIDITSARVFVSAWFDDNEDRAIFTSDSVFVDHNGGLYTQSSSGYWSASYVPDHAGDGEAFTIAPVPLAASFPLLALGLAAMAWAGRRRRPGGG